jgi:acyl-CoA synthetase (AMP-forming)/AMP-acid ligase II
MVIRSERSSSRAWKFADVFEQIAEAIPDALAQQQGARATTWSELDARADGIARALLDAGLVEQDKVAQYLYNTPEYLESVFGCFKAAMAPVNTNYRYAADELVYLWDNADVAAVVFHGVFAPTIEVLRSRVPRVRLWLWVDDGTGTCPEWATPYEHAATSTPGRTAGPWGRSGDDLLLLYTGGTTGMPKGVMWRQGDVFLALDANNRRRMPSEQDLSAIAGRTLRPGPKGLPGAPLMHGTGLFNAISTLMVGGSITTLAGRHFDPVELLDAVELHRINSMSIVGDAFAKPILRALDAEPDRWDISSLRVIVSSGVMWSKETKEGLLRHSPRLIMVDALGSSEAITMGTNTTTAVSRAETASFELGPHTRILAEDGRDVVPGSGEIGRVAMRGHMPIGYYKDPEKSAATFEIIDGVRYSVPGDWAEVLADGTVKLLGRGSQCINTGGEKVYPEEVEECLKLHPSVADAAVVGLPDERFGEAIHAIVEPAPGAGLDPNALTEHVKARLARYKAPKAIHTVSTIGRGVNGKLDYQRLKALAATASPDRVSDDPVVPGGETVSAAG